MKKILIILLFLFINLTYSQEKREYEKVDENTVKVKVYQNDKLTQKGFMVKSGEKWVNDGVWYQYDKDGYVNLKVKYSRGIKQRVIKKYDNYVVTIEKKGDL